MRTETSHRSQSLWLRTWRLQEVSSCACSIVAQCGVWRVSDTAHSEPGDAEISRAHLCRRRLRCIGFAQHEQAVSRAESALLACAGAARKGGAPPPAPPHRDDARRCASVLLRYQECKGPVFCCGRCRATRPTNCNFADICNRFLDLGLLLIIIIKLTGASTKMITGA